MDNADVREQVVKRSGRYDLVDVDGDTGLPDYETDLGADAFIDEARIWLYKRLPGIKAKYTPTYPFDDDASDWFMLNDYPVLVLASCAMIEASVRNTQGYNDFMTALQTKIMEIDKDLAQETSALYEDADYGVLQLQEGVDDGISSTVI